MFVWRTPYKQRITVKDLPDRYVFVSNPSSLPPANDGKVLPALPSSDDEVRRISRLLAGDRGSTLRGAYADETSVRNAMGSGDSIVFRRTSWSAATMRQSFNSETMGPL